MRTLMALSCLSLFACDTVDDGFDTSETTAPDTRDDTRDGDDTAAPDTRDGDDTAAPPDTRDDDDTGASDTSPTDTGPADTIADVADSADADADADDGADADDTSEDATLETIDVAPPAPPAILLTVAQIPAEMNGSRATVTPDGDVDFRLRVNRARFDLDLMALDDSGPFGLTDVERLMCIADGDMALVLPAMVEVAPGHLQIAIDEASAFPDGTTVTCDATVTTRGGTSSSSLTFDVATLPPELDPFPATDEWLVVTERDTFTLVVIDQGDGTTELRSEHTPDGVDDFDAPFFELGFFPASDPAATALIRAHLIARVRVLANGIYGLDAEGRPTADGVDLRLWFEGDAGAPDPDDYGQPGHRFSKMALTGDGAPNDQAGTTFGRASIDWNNQTTQDDTVYGLGVWPASVARAVLRNAAGALLLAEIRPALGGIPFGLAEGDDQFIGKDIDPTTFSGQTRVRAGRYQLLVEFGSLAIAAILTHEIGHSLGLVPYGPPPEGLFAGVEADWMASYAPDAHIDTNGLNVMQTGGSVNWLEAISGDRPRFEPLSWAYLRRQLVVGPVIDGP